MQSVSVKHYSHRELSCIYGISDRTLLKWLKPFMNDIGKKQGRYYTIAQVRIIFEKIGLPEVMDADENIFRRK